MLCIRKHTGCVRKCVNISRWEKFERAGLFFQSKALKEGLHTISGDVQLHQLCEVGNFGWQFLNLVVTEAQLSQIVQFEERLKGR